MKAVRINMNDGKSSKTIKAVVMGVIVTSAIIMLITIVLSLLLNITGNLFEGFAGYLMLLPLIIGGYLGGLTSAVINGSNGLVLGVVTSAIVYVIMLIAGFAAYNTNITYMILLKAICLMLPAIMGGIKGVNKKEKFRI